MSIRAGTASSTFLSDDAVGLCSAICLLKSTVRQLTQLLATLLQIQNIKTEQKVVTSALGQTQALNLEK